MTKKNTVARVKKSVRRRGSPDATHRNVRASNSRDVHLAERLRDLEGKVAELSADIISLSGRLHDIENSLRADAPAGVVDEG